MKSFALFFLSISIVLGGGNHNHHPHSHNHDHGHQGHNQSHSNHDHGSGHHDHTHLKKGHHHGHDKPKIHDALIHYSCESLPLQWKQLSSKPKSCPICLESNQSCGKILGVLQRKGVEYTLDELSFPNKICPVSKEKVKHDVFISYKGYKIFFNNPLNRTLFEKNPTQYLKYLELDPRGLGQKLVTHKSHLKGQK